MIAWILLAVVGGIFSIWGFIIYLLKYQRGEITIRFIYALFVGYASFVSFAVVNAIYPDFKMVTVILLPAFVAIVVLLREYQKTNESN